VNSLPDAVNPAVKQAAKPRRRASINVERIPKLHGMALAGMGDAASMTLISSVTAPQFDAARSRMTR
jgi:hypothetical protein